MSNPRTRILYLIELTSFTITTVLILINIYLLCIRSIHEFDIWFHLKAGEYIAQHGIPFYDPYSWLLQGKTWIDHSWLFQLILFKLYQSFGLPILFNIRFILLSLSVLIIILGLVKKKVPLGIITLCMFIPLTGLYSFTTLRPHLLSFFFFAITLHQIYSFLETNKITQLLPIIAIYPIWVNCHGYFLLAPFLIFILLVSQLLHRNPSFKTIFLILLSLGILSLISPYGAKELLYSVKTFIQNIGSDKVFFSYIQELRPPLSTLFSWDKDVILKISLFFCFFVYLLGWKKMEAFTLIAALSTAIFSLSALRHTAFWFIFCPISTSIILQRTLKNTYYQKKMIRLCFSLIPLLSILSSGSTKEFVNQVKGRSFSYTLYRFYPRSYEINYDRYPIKAVSFLRQIQFKGNILNNLNSGAFLIYSLWPEVRVGIDGRTELYGGKLFTSLLNATQYANFKKITQLANRYNVKAVLWQYYGDDTSDLFLYYLYKSSQWILVYVDPTTVIFMRNIPENALYIKQFAIGSLENFVKEVIRSLPENSDYQIPLRVSDLLIFLGEYKLSLTILEKLQHHTFETKVLSSQMLCYYKLKQYSKALEIAQKLSASFWLLRLYTQIGDISKAHAIANSLIPNTLWEKQVFMEYLLQTKQISRACQLKNELKNQVNKLTNGLLRSILLARINQTSGGRCK